VKFVEVNIKFVLLSTSSVASAQIAIPFRIADGAEKVVVPVPVEVAAAVKV
jgi:hypothetical protein